MVMFTAGNTAGITTIMATECVALQAILSRFLSITRVIAFPKMWYCELSLSMMLTF